MDIINIYVYNKAHFINSKYNFHSFQVVLLLKSWDLYEMTPAAVVIQITGHVLGTYLAVVHCLSFSFTALLQSRGVSSNKCLYRLEDIGSQVIGTK